MKQGLGWLMAVAAVMLCCGCVQAKPNAQPLEPSRLMISRGTNGVNMQWNADEGAVYTLYYRDTVGPDTTWKPVPGYENVAGQGKLIEFTDTAPTAKSRRYRVHTVTPAGR